VVCYPIAPAVGSEVVVKIAGGDEPAKRARICLLGGSVVEPVVELAGVNGELEAPGRKQDGGDDERETSAATAIQPRSCRPWSLMVVAPRKDATIGWPPRACRCAV